MSNKKILILFVIDLILSVGIIVYLVAGHIVQADDVHKQETMLDQQM